MNPTYNNYSMNTISGKKYEIPSDYKINLKVLLNATYANRIKLQKIYEKTNDLFIVRSNCDQHEHFVSVSGKIISSDTVIYNTPNAGTIIITDNNNENDLFDTKTISYSSGEVLTKTLKFTITDSDSNVNNKSFKIKFSSSILNNLPSTTRNITINTLINGDISYGLSADETLTIEIPCEIVIECAGQSYIIPFYPKVFIKHYNNI